jgi:hypothetical protein
MSGPFDNVVTVMVPASGPAVLPSSRVLEDGMPLAETPPVPISQHQSRYGPNAA